MTNECLLRKWRRVGLSAFLPILFKGEFVFFFVTKVYVAYYIVHFSFSLYYERISCLLCMCSYIYTKGFNLKSFDFKSYFFCEFQKFRPSVTLKSKERFAL